MSGQHTRKAVAARTPDDGLKVVETRLDPVVSPEAPEWLKTVLGVILAIGLTSLAGWFLWFFMVQVFG